MALFEIMMELGIFVLVGPEKYGTIYYRIRYLIGQKGGITYFFSLIIIPESKLIHIVN